jgi:hypothetical protein
MLGRYNYSLNLDCQAENQATAAYTAALPEGNGEVQVQANMPRIVTPPLSEGAALFDESL